MLQEVSDCTVLILTYKGTHHLAYLLPTLVEAVNHSPNYSIDIVVVDNAKDRETENFIKGNFQTVGYLAAKNEFLFSYNKIVKECKSKTVLILNDDLKVSKHIFNEAMPLFKNEKLFAVCCLFKDWGTEDIQLSWADISVSKGWMRVDLKKDDIDAIKYSCFACGGASFYRTTMFNELNGYDRIYYPAYYEDTDLSHRAWNKSWEIVVHPAAIVEHRVGGSWKNSKKENDLLILQQRNRIIGMLINCKEKGFLFWFILFLPYRLFYTFFFQKITFDAYIQAMSKIYLILKKRKKVCESPKMNHRKLFGTDYTLKNQ